MEESKVHCHSRACSQPAAFFYFNASSQAPACSQHIPSSSPVFPISLINLIRTPQDEPLYHSRSLEVTRGKTTLSLLLSALQTEMSTVLSDLSASKDSAHKTITAVYAAETRRTKQHFHQIEAAIAKVSQKFEHYLKVKEYTLPDLAKRLVAEGVSFPAVRHCRTWDNSLELAEAVAGSVYRRRVYWEKDVAVILSEEERGKEAERLLELVRETLEGDSYTGVQRALALCSESHLLRPCSESQSLKSTLEAKVSECSEARASSLLDHLTRDTDSISLLITVSQKAIAHHQGKGENWEVEDYYETLIEAASPLSQSKAMAALCATYANWYKENAPWPIQSKPETLLKESIRILKEHFAGDKAMAAAYRSLEAMYTEQNRISDACESCVLALTVLNTLSGHSQDSVEAWVRYSNLLLMNDSPQEAGLAWNEAITLCVKSLPDSQAAEVLFREGEQMIAWKRPMEAERCWKAAYLFGLMDNAWSHWEASIVRVLRVVT